MEDLKVQQKIIELGKKIVKELQLDPGVDTLSKWMSHYLAEKIELAKTLKGVKKKNADKECVEIILKLWDRRWSIPNKKPFFSDFEPLIETLEKLNPDRERPFFYNPIIQDGFDDEDKKTKTHFEMALKVDKIARSIIFDLLSQAVNELEISKEREEILRKSIESIDSLESRIIITFRNHNKPLKIEDEEVERHLEEIENLKNRISNLEKFSVLRNSLMDRYKESLSELEEQLIKNKQN
ncbi:hypothetical protein [Polaribacter vadi]|uniref:hypothetical protein n=1 Tax=Polaribacter vadi TaxID=1774273 RepID=UPI0030EEAC77|tara:strand:+ start:9195 stop:9911 length:717 start_codon:yes stop_codon:yes gene_type:complete